MPKRLLGKVLSLNEGSSRDDQSRALQEVMSLVAGIAGIQLGPEKRQLVETRLFRRARVLGLNSVADYLEYFKSHRDSEASELVSLITTHTTEFFREADHFDYLFDHVYPKIIKSRETVKIWSAASSSGQEIYSLAISWFEFLREQKIPLDQAPKVEFWGTDIDHQSVRTAQGGVYEREAVAKLPQQLVNRYFDFGSGDLSGFVRIKDDIHQLCHFQQMNLLAPSYSVGKFDIVFLRNVLIYFSGQDIEKICSKVARHLDNEGFLFLGHSESLQSLQTDFQLVGNAIYNLKTARALVEKKSESGQGVAAEGGPIRVMIVDDSRSVRAVLKKVLSIEHGFEVVAEAMNPIEAEKMLKGVQPDVMTLDIHMPEMDGITYLSKLASENAPFPVVMISSVSHDEATNAMKCFELGAFEYIEKPSGLRIEEEGENIRQTLRQAAKSKGTRTVMPVIVPRDARYQPSPTRQDLIVIGSSTGGPEAVRAMMKGFPRETPPIVIVQHIPPVFSHTFAKRLDDLGVVKVKEGESGDILLPNHAYVAPGGKQMKVISRGKNLVLEINDDAPVNRHRPSVDYLFQSVAEIKSRNRNLTIAAVILTGMGGDGAKGLKALRNQGAFTLAQDEETCVVFGMPRVAIEMDAAEEVRPLQSIAYHLFSSLNRAKAA